MTAKKIVNLALQGGGAHGAFTWGVLDAFLEDGRLEFSGISGTSAGAMNAVVLADGLRRGGADTARAELHDFWRSVSLDGSLSGAQRGLFDAILGFWEPFGPPAKWVENASSFLAPAQINPLDINLLRDAVGREIDFEALRTSDGPKLFIAATNVWSGKARVFERRELTLDMVMASACLPLVFRAVEVEGQPYWDGGYTGNPPLFPFFSGTEVSDVILIQINPIERRETPDSSSEIMDRINEITFNSPLLAEFRAIDFVARLIESGRLDGTNYKRVLMHLVEADARLKALGGASKMKAEYSFFKKLFEIGRQSGKEFLDENFDSIGVTGTLALKEKLV
jgi:NTE family protein